MLDNNLITSFEYCLDYIKVNAEEIEELMNEEIEEYLRYYPNTYDFYDYMCDLEMILDDFGTNVFIEYSSKIVESLLCSECEFIEDTYKKLLIAGPNCLRNNLISYDFDQISNEDKKKLAIIFLDQMELIDKFSSNNIQEIGDKEELLEYYLQTYYNEYREFIDNYG